MNRKDGISPRASVRVRFDLMLGSNSNSNSNNSRLRRKAGLQDSKNLFVGEGNAEQKGVVVSYTISIGPMSNKAPT